MASDNRMFSRRTTLTALGTTGASLVGLRGFTGRSQANPVICSTDTDRKDVSRQCGGGGGGGPGDDTTWTRLKKAQGTEYDDPYGPKTTHKEASISVAQYNVGWDNQIERWRYTFSISVNGQMWATDGTQESYPDKIHQTSLNLNYPYGGAVDGHWIADNQDVIGCWEHFVGQNPANPVEYSNEFLQAGLTGGLTVLTSLASFPLTATVAANMGTAFVLSAFMGSEGADKGDRTWKWSYDSANPGAAGTRACSTDIQHQLVMRPNRSVDVDVTGRCQSTIAALNTSPTTGTFTIYERGYPSVTHADQLTKIDRQNLHDQGIIRLTKQEYKQLTRSQRRMLPEQTRQTVTAENVVYLGIDSVIGQRVRQWRNTYP